LGREGRGHRRKFCGKGSVKRGDHETLAAAWQISESRAEPIKAKLGAFRGDALNTNKKSG